ncbi:hypothetical protein DFH28DRAFT_522934 [Melampsora americana]|nr:hypothetical protein DFH28DRAFT_522934 [Melampsora americana]
MDELRVISIFPFDASSIHYLDIILPPFLLSLSIILYDLSNHSSKPIHSNRSHLFYNQTHHARFLPSSSKHQFNYTLLQFGLDLDQLESDQLNLPFKLFKFITSTSKLSNWFLTFLPITSIHPKDYLHPSSISSQSIKSSLLQELNDHHQIDVKKRIGSVYLITMPSYLGYEAMNPLSVYFCYAPIDENKAQRDGNPTHAPLSVVVLEVHNTFSERHLYVLQVGVEEVIKPQSGYHHQWNIPRAFHVSPFNDRSGTYQVCLSDPFSLDSINPTLKIKITLFTNTGEKKLFASLAGSSQPLTTLNLISALVSYPLTLLLTSLRILYQSYFLHYGKARLDVYPRPEAYSNLTPNGPNPIEKGGKVGGVGWQKVDGLSRLARRRVIKYLKNRVNELAIESDRSVEVHQKDDCQSDHDLNEDEDKDEDEDEIGLILTPISITLRSIDPLEPEIKINPISSTLAPEELVINYSSPRFFVDLLTYPTPHLALLVGGQTEGRWNVSSFELFSRFFLSSFGPRLPFSSQRKPNLRFFEKYILSLRLSRLKWSLSFLPNSLMMKGRTSWVKPPYFLPIDLNGYQPDGIGDGFQDLLVIGFAYLEELMGVWIGVKLLRVRYGDGFEPWMDWFRAISPKKEDVRRVGSLVRDQLGKRKE